MEPDGINVFDTTQDVGAILPPQINAPGPLASYFTRPMVPSPASRRRDTLKGIAQFVPFLSGEIAKYDNDKLGMALSSLDALGPAGTAVKGTLAIGKQAAKKGVGSLDQPKDMMFVHNTSEDAIKSFDEMGGIPSPSLDRQAKKFRSRCRSAKRGLLCRCLYAQSTEKDPPGKRRSWRKVHARLQRRG